MIKIAIAGGNIEGSALLSLLRTEPNIKIVALYEEKPDAPGSLLSTKWGIPVCNQLENLKTYKPDMVINVTGLPEVTTAVRKELGDNVEILNTSGAKLLWDIIEKQKKSRVETLKTIQDQNLLIDILSSIFLKDEEKFLDKALKCALEITDSPAGSIVGYEKDQFRLKASRGLSKRFIENTGWSTIPGGITAMVVKEKKIVEIQDTLTSEFNNPSFLVENIRAVLAVPLLSGVRVAGILFIDDFRPRRFSTRQKSSVKLLSNIVGLALERLPLLEELNRTTRDLNALNEGLEKKVLERTEVLEKLNRELANANELKGKFIANTSHELRTPLNSIIGFSDILLEETFGQLSEEQRRYITNIRIAGKHLLHLINNILDIAKIEAGKYELQYETFYIDEVIHEVINTMRPLADEKSINLTVSIAPDVNSLTADRVKLKQILYNLLSNAIKFTPEGGRVKIYAEMLHGEDLESVKFVVSDTGIGISPDEIEKIFNEFEQVDTSFARQYGGAGLGLALTRKLIELQGGSIKVESTLGEGSKFYFTIPSGEAPEGVEVQEVEAVRLNFPWMKEEAPLILVVEDDLSTAELLTLHLTQAGYKVARAYDGEEAVEKAKTLRPFAITLDVMLPKKDGWEVLQELKSDEFTSDIPVIIHSIVDNRDLAFALGATDYLLKPLDKEVLLQKLDELSASRGKACTPSTVLVIEPDEEEAESLKNILQDAGLITYIARDTRKGLELAVALRPNLIITTLDTTNADSLDIIKELKTTPSTRNIPIFIMTDTDITVDERMNLLGKIERIIKKHAFDTKELIDHIKELEIFYPKRAGLIDELTGLFSHRYFQIRLAQEVERASRYKIPLILIILDIDHFGNYMKQNGEYNGNLVLKKVAEFLKKNIRGSDIVVRYGGDSFAVLLPNTVLAAGLSLSNRFNAIIKNYPFPHEESQPKGKITSSAGLAFLEGQSPEELILCAEKALAVAIKKGGDRVEVHSGEKDEALLP